MSPGGRGIARGGGILGAMILRTISAVVLAATATVPFQAQKPASGGRARVALAQQPFSPAGLSQGPVTMAAWLPSANTAAAQPPASIEDRLPGEAMYPLASEDVWTHVRAMVRALGFRTEKNDGKHQVLVTNWRSYDLRILPDAARLGLQDGDRPLRVQFHVLVARDRQPARVAAGAILEIERAVDGRRTTVLGYRPPVLDRWFLSALDERAGVSPIGRCRPTGRRAPRRPLR